MMTAVLSRCILCVGLVVAAGWLVPSVAQEAPAAQTNTPGKSTGGDPTNPANSMAMRMARERNAIRQKQVVSQADQLLVLAQQLKAALDKRDRNQLPADAVKTADHIQKLAKSIKDKMREGSSTPCVFFDQPGCIPPSNPTQFAP